MYEKSVKLRNGNYKIYGFLSVPEKNTDSIVIFIHGLLDNAGAPIIKTSSELLVQKGFATFCFDLYSNKKGARVFEKTGFEDYLNDINLIISTFQKKYKNIHIVAHSLGAYTTLLINKKVKSMIFWDPSLHPSRVFSAFEYNKSKKIYYDKQLNSLISKKMLDEIPKLPSVEDLLKKSEIPTALVFAEKGALCLAEKYKQNIKNLSDFVVIKKADHNFSTKTHRVVLAKMTYSLIKKLPVFYIS